MHPFCQAFGPALAQLVFASCGNDDDCLPWDARAHPDGIGDLRFDSEGPDCTARALIRNCGFAVDNGHDGGNGDILQIGTARQAGPSLPRRTWRERACALPDRAANPGSHPCIF